MSVAHCGKIYTTGTSELDKFILLFLKFGENKPDKIVSYIIDAIMELQPMS
jgi:hypothetical protein